MVALASAAVVEVVRSSVAAALLLMTSSCGTAAGAKVVVAAVIIAVGVNSDGRREVLGMDVGASEAEPFWKDFLRSLTHRGLRGVKLVISDAHEGLKGAITRVMGATWQRCRVHFMRNALAHAGRRDRKRHV